MRKRARHNSNIALAAAMAVAAVFLIPDAAFACDSCWGAKVDTPTTRGISLAMMALIGMTSIVWGGIGAFFLHVARRARLLEPGEMIVTERGDLRNSKDRNEDDELF